MQFLSVQLSEILAKLTQLDIKLSELEGKVSKVSIVISHRNDHEELVKGLREVVEKELKRHKVSQIFDEFVS